MKKYRFKKKEYSDEELIEKCEKQTATVCSTLKWTDRKDLEVVKPENTVALVVDMNHTSGSVRFYTVEDEYLTMVGQESKNRFVLVPWKDGLKYVCYGECRIGEVEGQDRDDV